jgi:sulfur-carrier protein
MNITVKYFASLREQLGKAEELLTLKDATSISEVWQNVSGETTSENILMAINMEYVKSDAIVKEGDEVAFFPPVTGG